MRTATTVLRELKANPKQFANVTQNVEVVKSMDEVIKVLQDDQESGSIVSFLNLETDDDDGNEASGFLNLGSDDEKITAAKGVVAALGKLTFIPSALAVPLNVLTAALKGEDVTFDKVLPALKTLKLGWTLINEFKNQLPDLFPNTSPTTNKHHSYGGQHVNYHHLPGVHALLGLYSNAMRAGSGALGHIKHASTNYFNSAGNSVYR